MGADVRKVIQKIIIRDEPMRARLCALISRLDLEKEWQVTIERYKEWRSLEQNRYYWLIVGVIAQETGNDPDSVHEALKQKFLIPDEISFMGEKVLYRSTTRLDTKAMSEYLDKVHALATQELGILLPVPDAWPGRDQGQR